MQHTQQVAVGARAVEKKGTPSKAVPRASLVLKCASLGLWAEAREVYEFAVEAEAAEMRNSGIQEGVPQARIQSEICALIKKYS
jgi:hypothetical protein